MITWFLFLGQHVWCITFVIYNFHVLKQLKRALNESNLMSFGSLNVFLNSVGVHFAVDIWICVHHSFLCCTHISFGIRIMLVLKNKYDTLLSQFNFLKLLFFPLWYLFCLDLQFLYFIYLSACIINFTLLKYGSPNVL